MILVGPLALIGAPCFHICVHQEGEGDYYYHQMMVNFMLTDLPLNRSLGSGECLRSGFSEGITMEKEPLL